MDILTRGISIYVLYMLRNASFCTSVCVTRETKKEEQKERAWALGHHSGSEQMSPSSEVSGGLGGEGLDAAGVTVFAEDVSIQRVASLVVPLWQQRATVLQDADTFSPQTQVWTWHSYCSQPKSDIYQEALCKAETRRQQLAITGNQSDKRSIWLKMLSLKVFFIICSKVFNSDILFPKWN